MAERSRERMSGEIARLSKSRLAHVVFWIGILFKAVDGVLETLGGIVLLTISNVTMTNAALWVVGPELTEDPNDWLANHLLSWTLHLSANARLFAIVYLLTHGIIKIVIVAAIWLGHLWAYWLAGIVFGLFMIYQMARFFVTHSMMMLALTALDLVVIALLPPEYKRVSNELGDRVNERS
ncbi:MAG: DUF2127 domain-containing protein [Solirubrobacterales bacterium]